jgi:hypothetical protein
MANFTVRVELYGARRVFRPLHAAMENAGFKRAKTFYRGRTRSQGAEYLISELAGTSRSVCDLVSAMVDALHTPNSILVREGGASS